MGIEYTVESLDQVSEDIRGAYVEADGKYSFDPDKYAELKAAGLKRKRDELLGKVKQHEGELAKVAKFKPLIETLADADDDEISNVLEQWQKRGEKQKSGNHQQDDSVREKAHQREVKKLSEELTTAQTELQKAQTELREFRLWTPLRDVFIKAGGEPADWELARLELASQGRFGFDDDGKIVVMEDGYPSTIAPEKFFKDVYSDLRPKFYKASSAAGSGATNGTTRGAAGVDFSKMTPTERLQKARELGVKE